MAASSFFTVTNPSGDSTTQYSFEDNGGGTGYFTMGGTVEPNDQAFIVNAGNLSSVQYFGGGSAGTDTLVVDAYDASAAVWLSSASISAVTTAPFPFANVADFTQALYIGYFGRAGDPGGDAYWLNQLNSGNISEAGMAASFSVQSEATALYSFLANPPVATIAQIDSFMGQFTKIYSTEHRMRAVLPIGRNSYRPTSEIHTRSARSFSTSLVARKALIKQQSRTK